MDAIRLRLFLNGLDAHLREPVDSLNRMHAREILRAIRQEVDAEDRCRHTPTRPLACRFGAAGELRVTFKPGTVERVARCCALHGAMYEARWNMGRIVFPDEPQLQPLILSLTWSLDQ
jgi:hypothetical protein